MTDITDIREMKARIIVFGVGGAGGNAVNNMIASGLQGVDFVVANTDAQVLATSKAKGIIQLGTEVTQGLGAGSQPELGRAAAEEAVDAIRDRLTGAHMVFVTAGMGGGTGTGAAPVIARTARELGILTIGVVTKPFQFEGQRRMRSAEAGIAELLKVVDTLLVIPNQNLFRVATEKTTFANAFVMADQVLYSGVACISDLIVKEGLINLDFADVLTVMREKGKAMMGRGEASGEKRVLNAAVAAISNPLIEDPSIKRASGLIISITGGKDLTLFEIEEAATRIREEVDHNANVIVGATFDDSLDGIVRVSVVATGIDNLATTRQTQPGGHPDGTPGQAAQRQPSLGRPDRVRARRRGEVRCSARRPAPRHAHRKAGFGPCARCAAARPRSQRTLPRCVAVSSRKKSSTSRRSSDARPTEAWREPAARSRVAERLGCQAGPTNERMREGADFPVAQQPRDLGDRQLPFPKIAFGKRLSQHFKDDRERDALGRQGTSKRSMAHAKAGGDLRRAGLAVRKQLSDLIFNTRTHAGAP